MNQSNKLEIAQPQDLLYKIINLIVKPTNYILPKLDIKWILHCNNWNVYQTQQLKFPFSLRGNNRFTKWKPPLPYLTKINTLLLVLTFLKPNYFQIVLIAGMLIRKFNNFPFSQYRNENGQMTILRISVWLFWKLLIIFWWIFPHSHSSLNYMHHKDYTNVSNQCLYTCSFV